MAQTTPTKHIEGHRNVHCALGQRSRQLLRNDAVVDPHLKLTAASGAAVGPGELVMS